MSRKSEDQLGQMAAAFNRAPVDQDRAASAPAALPPRTKPVRFSLDLAPDLHRRLKLWAVEADANVVDVLRILAARMLDDPDLADQVRRALRD